MSILNWHALESKMSSVERDLFTKANSWELDIANTKIRELEDKLSSEEANRQSLEERYLQLLQRVEVLESSAPVDGEGER